MTAHSHPVARPLVLGVDGGGTKTLAWLAECDEQGEAAVVGRGISGSSNQVAVGLETALENLALSIERAFAGASKDMAPLAAGVFALAGSGTTQARKQIIDSLSQRFAIGSLQVIHDGQAVLQAGAPEGRGIALIVGTGAVAYGNNKKGETAVVGGWGYWFGDEGSAFWLGQAALRAISQAADKRAQQTTLTESILARLEVGEPREMLAALTQTGDTRKAIASLADLVCEAAEQQDYVANEILMQAVDHWLTHITSLADRLMPGEPFPLVLAGGVLCGSDHARGLLLEQLQQLTPPICICELVAEPVLGCVRLACLEMAKRSSIDSKI